MVTPGVVPTGEAVRGRKEPSEIVAEEAEAVKSPAEMVEEAGLLRLMPTETFKLAVRLVIVVLTAEVEREALAAVIVTVAVRVGLPPLKLKENPPTLMLGLFRLIGPKETSARDGSEPGVLMSACAESL